MAQQLEIGIVGLPNVGKSTLFNALAQRRVAKTAMHPFTTIDPNIYIVQVSDQNLLNLSNLIHPNETTPATVTFIDIAGLVKDANKGEGLGNQFLAKIREVDATVHVLRSFEDPNVPHVHGKIDPKSDLEIVNLELELGGISKPTLYVLNINEKEYNQKSIDLIVSQYTSILVGKSIIVISAKIEEELSELSEEEKKEYLSSLGLKESGVERLIKEAYKLLNLITFYTIKGGKEVRATPIVQNSNILEAAEKIHTDFAKNFIKAEVVPVQTLIELGSWKKAHEAGKIALAGRDYIVKDGDVIEFKIGN